MNTLQKEEDYHEGYGDCIFFHFYSFQEPPDVCCGSPLDYEWDEKYWTHFIALDFNHIFTQAMNLSPDLQPEE